MTGCRLAAIVVPTIVATIVATGAVAGAQAYMTPLPPAPNAATAPQPPPPPHRLDRNPLIGTSIELGSYTFPAANNTTGTAFVQDGWLGYGLGDRLAALLWGALQVAGNQEWTETHIAAGAGVRAWPIDEVPQLSLEGRVGLVAQQVMYLSGASSGPYDLQSTGVTAAGVAVVDLVQRPMIGIEARATLSTIVTDGHNDVMVTGGLGVSFY